MQRRWKKEEEKPSQLPPIRFKWVTFHHFFTLHKAELFLLETKQRIFSLHSLGPATEKNIEIKNGNSPIDDSSVVSQWNCSSISAFGFFCEKPGRLIKNSSPAKQSCLKISSVFTFLKLYGVFRKYVSRLFFCLRENTQEIFFWKKKQLNIHCPKHFDPFCWHARISNITF